MQTSALRILWPRIPNVLSSGKPAALLLCRLSPLYFTLAAKLRAREIMSYIKY